MKELHERAVVKTIIAKGKQLRDAVFSLDE
jgi:hypothetical protein